MGETLHRLASRAAIGVLVVACCGASAGAAAKGKLVHMHNGKVIKVESVERDGGWVTLVLTGEHRVGFPADAVKLVEDDLVGADEVGSTLNVVTSGRYVPNSSFAPERPTVPENPRGQREAAVPAEAEPAQVNQPPNVQQRQQQYNARRRNLGGRGRPRGDN